MRHFSIVAFVFAVSLSLVLPVSALANNFGAIAFSPGSGALGWSFDYRSRASAENVALSSCFKHAGDCRIATWFTNACGAIAVGNGNGWGAYWANTRHGAENKAMKLCYQRTGNCSVRRWVCTTK